MEDGDDFLAALALAASAQEEEDAADGSREKLSSSERRRIALEREAASHKVRFLGPMWFLEDEEAGAAAVEADSQHFDLRLEGGGASGQREASPKDRHRARMQVRLARANHLYARGEHAAALDAARGLWAAAEQAGEDSDHLLLSLRDTLARAALAAGDLDAAAAVLPALTARLNEDPGAWVLAARIKEARGEPPEEAARAYARALALAPRHAASWLEVSRLSREADPPFAWLAALMACVLHRNSRMQPARYAASIDARERTGAAARAEDALDGLSAELGLPPSSDFRGARAAAADVRARVTEPWRAEALVHVHSFMQSAEEMEGGGGGGGGDDGDAGDDEEIGDASYL